LQKSQQKHNLLEKQQDYKENNQEQSRNQLKKIKKPNN